MKKIGFIDLYISEWHANNYPAWIRESCQERGLEYEVAYAWAEVEVSPRDGKTTDQWCAENNVTRCNSIEEICETMPSRVFFKPSLIIFTVSSSSFKRLFAIGRSSLHLFCAFILVCVVIEISLNENNRSALIA